MSGHLHEELATPAFVPDFTGWHPASMQLTEDIRASAEVLYRSGGLQRCGSIKIRLCSYLLYFLELGRGDCDAIRFRFSGALWRRAPARRFGRPARTK